MSGAIMHYFLQKTVPGMDGVWYKEVMERCDTTKKLL